MHNKFSRCIYVFHTEMGKTLRIVWSSIQIALLYSKVNQFIIPRKDRGDAQSAGGTPGVWVVVTEVYA